MHKPRRDDDVRLTPGRMLILGLLGGLVVSLAMISLPLPPRGGLAELVLQNTPQSGVASPVTAVLINFRGYDTLLEIAVLLLAVIGIWSIARSARVWVRYPDTPVLAAFVRIVMPLMVFVAGYLLWLGADEPGGAFQGGAVLAGMGIVWVAAAVWQPGQRVRWLIRPLLVLGLLSFVLIALGLLVLEGNFLQYPPEQAKNLILVIESAATLSIGITLTLLFIGGIPRMERSE